MFVNGRKSNYDLPMLIALGASYDPFDFLTVAASVNTYFISLSDTGETDEDAGGYNDNYSVGIDVAVGVEYRPWKFLAVSTGYQYGRTSGSEKTYNDFDFALDSHAFNLGVRYTPWEFISFTVGANYVYFQKGKDMTGAESFNKRIFACAVGVEYRYLTKTGGASGMDLRRRK